MAAFFVGLAVYVPSLSSQPWTGDTAEYQTVPYILGIAHPTGFPAYTLAGWAWSHALAFGTVAWRGVLFASAYRLDVELYRYFLVSSAVIAALAAAATRLPLPRIAPVHVADVVALVLVLTAVLTWYDHRSLAAAYRYTGAQATIDAIGHDVPDGAIIVANWYDVPTLAYGAFIEHALGTRTVVHALPDTIAAQLPSWRRVRRVFLFGWNGEIADATLPPQWLHDRPSSLRGYRLVEVNP